MDQDENLCAFGSLPAMPATQEMIINVRDALKAMPPKLSLLLKLNLWGGLSAREIAEKTGSSQKTVSRNLTAAKEMFREIVGTGGKSVEHPRQHKRGPA